jgi:hypothetical protein
MAAGVFFFHVAGRAVFSGMRDRGVDENRSGFD